MAKAMSAKSLLSPMNRSVTWWFPWGTNRPPVEHSLSACSKANTFLCTSRGSGTAMNSLIYTIPHFLILLFYLFFVYLYRAFAGTAKKGYDTGNLFMPSCVFRVE